MEGALGLIGGLAGAAINASWQAANYNLQLENLRWQKKQGERQFKLASAGSTDAFGNKQKYDELLNEWKLALTPTQQKITSAGEKEQLRSLTEDADRNRRIRERQAKRGDVAAEDYINKRAEYLYAAPPEEATLRGQFQNLLQGASNEKATKNVTELSREAIRTGRGAMVPQLIRAGWSDTNADWAENLLKARTMGLQESTARETRHESKYLPALKALQDTMDMGGDMPQRFSDVPNRLAKEQGEQNKLMLSALQNEAGNVQGAYAGVGKALSQGGVDLKGLASMMGSMGRGGSGGKAGRQLEQSYQQPIENDWWNQAAMDPNLGDYSYLDNAF